MISTCSSLDIIGVSKSRKRWTRRAACMGEEM